jgi:hypothetical protein
MGNSFEVEDGKYGPSLVLCSSWQADIAEYILEHQIKELQVNYARGWRGRDLMFLSSVPHLEAFKIIDWNIDDITPIHYLTKLRSLEVSTYCKTEIDFLRFPNLEECALEWRPRAKSLFKCKKLKSLFLNRYTGKDLANFSELLGLESLSIANSPIRNLEGLEPLKRLTFLGLYRLRKLQSISTVSKLSNLEELEINECRAFGTIDGITKLGRLRKLQLLDDGNIDTLAGLDSLENLESFFFYGSTNIVDGDLSPLTKLERLHHLSFRERRHYSHKLGDFRTLRAAS